MKIKPFLSRRSSQIFIGTVILVQPYWIMEIYATFAYFNNMNDWLFPRTRPIEALFRDPWWVAACGKLLWVLKDHYDISLRNVVIINPRFGVMMAAMFLSIVFVLFDILSVTEVFKNAPTVGVNPFWKLALVFKCLTDTVILDDFKTALDRMWTFRRESLGIASPLVNRRRPKACSNPKTPGVDSREYAEHSSLQSSTRDRNQLEDDLGRFEMQSPPATLQLSD